MEIKRPKIKSMKYEDFNDNEYLEQMAQELRKNGTNVIVGCLDRLIEWGRSNSLWPLTFATSCCGIEFMAVGAARYDFARFGFEVARASPRQADFIMVAGTITHKMAPVLKRLYDQMADPEVCDRRGRLRHQRRPLQEVLSRGARASTRSFPWMSTSRAARRVPGGDALRPDQLQRKVRLQRFFGGVNRQISKKEYEELLSATLRPRRTI